MRIFRDEETKAECSRKEKGKSDAKCSDTERGGHRKNVFFGAGDRLVYLQLAAAI